MDDKTPTAPGVRRPARRVLGYALGVVLLYSSLAHIENPYVFLDTVYSYQLVGVEAGVYAAAAVPFLQLVLALTLVAGVWPRESFALAAALFAVFAAAQGVAFYRGQQISCGCFGAAGPQVGWQTLSVAGTCAAASAAGLILSLGGCDEPPAPTG